jgi:hypothetical protein
VTPSLTACGEAKALRYADPRRAKLIYAAIEATIAAYRGKPIIRDGEDIEDPVETDIRRLGAGGPSITSAPPAR